MFENYPDILNFKQFREALAVGKNKAYQLLKNGEVKHFKIGNTYKIPKIALINYINQQIKDY